MRWLLIVVAGCRFQPDQAHPADAIASDARLDAPGDAALDAPPDAYVPIEVAQTCSRVVFTTSQLVTCAMPVAQVATHTNLVVVDWSGSGSISSVVDSKGNSYASTGVSVMGSATEVMYYAPNIRAAAAGTNIVSATTTAGVDFLKIRVLEYVGLRTVMPFETATTAVGTGVTLMVGPVMTTTPHVVLVAASRPQNVTVAVPPFVARDTSDGDLIEDRSVFEPGTYDAAATQAAGGGYVMILAAFRGQ